MFWELLKRGYEISTILLLFFSPTQHPADLSSTITTTTTTIIIIVTEKIMDIQKRL